MRNTQNSKETNGMLNRLGGKITGKKYRILQLNIQVILLWSQKTEQNEENQYRLN